MEVILDTDAGFCFGVNNAIDIAEKHLQDNKKTMFCIGEIVHNEAQNAILQNKGMKTVVQDDLKHLKNAKVLIRAHGEPPQTYKILQDNNAEIIDATCPIVKRLQEKIKKQYVDTKNTDLQIVIFGKHNHPEVVGLLGNADNKAVVIESSQDFSLLDFSKPISIYSQTTMEEEKYLAIIEDIRMQMLQHNNTNLFINKSVCRQVSKRVPNLRDFARQNDVIIFVAGANSSNGKYLFNVCKDVNNRSYKINAIEDIEKQWFADAQRVGVSGATSTPMWQMQEVAQFIRNMQ